MSEALLQRKGAEREMSNLTVQSFRPRLVNENNSCKLAFARVGSKGIDVNGSKRLSHTYGVHLRTKIIENKRQFEVQKLDYPCRNLVI